MGKDLREKADNVFMKLPLGEDKVGHSRAVCECAEKIANNMKKRGVEVDLDVVYAAALLHDIGITKAPFKSEAEEEENPWPEHAVEGAKIALQGGLPDSVAEAIQAHEQLGFNQTEMDELKFVAPAVGKNWGSDSTESKIVAAADQVVYIVRHMQLDAWKDQDAILKANFSYVDTLYKKRTGRGVKRDHPALIRMIERTREILPYIQPNEVPAPWKGISVLKTPKGPSE